MTFWRDGLGFAVLMDQEFDGPWPELFGGSATTLRAVFLGDANAPESGVVELVELEGMGDRAEPGAGPPPEGFLLLSLYADLDEVLPRLAALGVGGDPVIGEVAGVRLAVLRDPNGVRVELMDSPAQANVAYLAARP